MNSTITDIKQIFKPKPARNKKLYADYKNKTSVPQLQKKYDLSRTRVYNIINQMKRKEADKSE